MYIKYLKRNDLKRQQCYLSRLLACKPIIWHTKTSQQKCFQIRWSGSEGTSI